jgi:hypothetical protein
LGSFPESIPSGVVNSSLFSQVNRVEFGPARTVPFVWLRVAMLTFSSLSVFAFSVAAQVPPNGGLARYPNAASTVLERPGEHDEGWRAVRHACVRRRAQ